MWDRERVIIIPDHYIFTSDPRANRNVDILREFVQEQNIKCVQGVLCWVLGKTAIGLGWLTAARVWCWLLNHTELKIEPH